MPVPISSSSCTAGRSVHAPALSIDYSKQLQIVRPSTSFAMALKSCGYAHVTSKSLNEGGYTRETGSQSGLTENCSLSDSKVQHATEVISNTSVVSSEDRSKQKTNILIPERVVTSLMPTEDVETNLFKADDVYENLDANEFLADYGKSGVLTYQINRENNFHKLEYINGKFYHVSKDPHTKEITKEKEVSIEEVARYVMYPFSRNSVTPRSLYERPLYYFRFNDTGSPQKFYVFGKPLTTYSLALEDFIFLITLICQQASRFQHQIKITYLCFLLTQSFHKRNFPLRDNKELGISYLPSIIHSSFNDTKEEYSLKDAVPCIQGSSVLKTSLSEIDHSGAFFESIQFRRKTYSALDRMDHQSIVDYKKKMGPYITDEVFLYLIQLFETLSGRKECIALEVAAAEARHHLGPLSTSHSILRQVHSYWVSRRIALGKPLLRERWPAPSASDNNSFTVFRTRAKEKMMLRRPRRRHIDFKSRVKEFSTQLDAAQHFFEECYARDTLMLHLCCIDACLFEQKLKGKAHSSYIHPLWHVLCKGLEDEKHEPLLSTSSQYHGVTCLDPVQESTQDASEKLNKESKTTGPFLLEPVEGTEASHSFEPEYVPRPAKRRRIGTRLFTLKNTTITSQVSSSSEKLQKDMSQVERSDFCFFPPKLLSHEWYESRNLRPPYSHSSSNEVQQLSPCSVSMQASKASIGHQLWKSHDSGSHKSKSPCGFMSFVPLPPIYLNLPLDCSQATLRASLQAAWVSLIDAERPPVGYISCHSLPSNYYATLPFMNIHGKNASSSVNNLCTTASRGVSSCQTKRFSNLIAHDRTITMDLNPAAPDVSGIPSLLPVYRQSLECLPQPIRFEANRRLVIPYSIKPEICSQMGKGCSFLELDQPYVDSSIMRLNLRIGRGGCRRPWLDRHRFTPPTLSNLTPNPVVLSADSRSVPFSLVHQSTETFMQAYLETNAQRIKRALEHSAETCTASRHLKILRDILEPKNQLSISQKGKSVASPLYKPVRLSLMSDGNRFLMSLLDFSLLKKIDGASFNVSTKDLVTVFLSAQESLFPLVALPYNCLLHNPSVASLLSSASLTSHLATSIMWFSLYASGFYPSGFGGPECSLSGSRRSDFEPSFVGVLGVDAPSSCGGFHLFSIIRDRTFFLAKVNKASDFSSASLVPYFTSSASCKFRQHCVGDGNKNIPTDNK